jgi:hypothetical protein
MAAFSWFVHKKRGRAAVLHHPLPRRDNKGAALYQFSQSHNMMRRFDASADRPRKHNQLARCLGTNPRLEKFSLLLPGCNTVASYDLYNTSGYTHSIHCWPSRICKVTGAIVECYGITTGIWVAGVHPRPFGWTLIILF